MKVNFLYTVLSLALFFSLMINGQTLKQVPSNDGTPFNSKFCGTDSIHNEKMKSDPDY